MRWSLIGSDDNGNPTFDNFLSLTDEQGDFRLTGKRQNHRRYRKPAGNKSEPLCIRKLHRSS